MSAPGDGDSGRWLILFVHGVGGFKPEEMASAAARAIDQVRPGFGKPSLIRTEMLGDGPPVLLVDTTMGACRVRTTEVFWGDISRVRASWSGLIIGAMSTFLRLRHVIESVRRLDDPVARAIGPLLRLMTWVLRYGVLPLAIVAAGLGIIGFLMRAFVEIDRFDAQRTAPLVIAGSLLMAALAAATWWRLRRATDGWEMGAPIAVAVVATSLATALVAIGDGWIMPAFLDGVLCPQDHCFNAAKSGTGKQPPFGLHIAANIKVQDWVLGAGLILLTSAIVLVKSAEYGGADAAKVRSLRISATAAVTFFVFYFLVTKPLDLLTVLYLGWSAKSLNLYWYDVVIAAFGVLVGALTVRTMVARRAWARARAGQSSGRRAPYEDEQPARILLPRTYETLAFGLAVVMTLTAIGNEASKYIPGGDGEPFLQPIELPSVMIAIAALGAAPLILWLSPTLRVALAVAMDVVDHFFEPDSGLPTRVRRRERLERALDQGLEGMGRPNLLIVAHSQGTVIVLDALRDGILEKKCAGRIGDLKLLTLGSPIRHIYQHYFGHSFPHLAAETLGVRELAPRLQWINLYRVDDYVGRRLALPDSAMPDEIELPGLGGHTRYWEEDVLAHLEAERAHFLPR